MSDKDDPKTFLSKKLSEGETNPEQVTVLESKEQREYFRFLKTYGAMGFDFLIESLEYEQRMNMSKGSSTPQSRSEQLVRAIVGIDTQEKIRQGIQPIDKKRSQDVGQL